MQKYHINGEGNPGVCSAGRSVNGRPCPFGGESDHYASVPEAREAYERQMETFADGATAAAATPAWSPKLPQSSVDYFLNSMADRLEEIKRRPDDFTGYQLANYAEALNDTFGALLESTQDPKLLDAFQGAKDELKEVISPNRPSTDKLLLSHFVVRDILRDAS